MHYSKEEIAEVKRIQTTIQLSKKKDMIRSVLGGPLCCVCHTTVPTKRVEYDNGRLETYCEEHFPIYERTKDVDIQDIAKTWNCQIAPSEGYSLRPKSILLIILSYVIAAELLGYALITRKEGTIIF